MVERRIRDRPLPLLAWLEVRRAERQRIRARRLRLGRHAALLGIGIACLGVTIAVPPLPRLVWNASASAPIGLYAVSPGASLERGDMAIAWPPIQARQLAARRHYLPSNVPLVKRVSGIAGDTICAVDSVVTVNGRPVAQRRAADAAGRQLPAWRGCIRLGPGTHFLLLTETPDSFDGRYFGPTLTQDVIGKATPLWLR
ncbi:S26 family signal peptidase [Sphingomonas sp. R647]|uniref:S26 family signal peptidase n=1 Tax=unclassified Sphingomonas TaxID=196159 RepID=UPI001CD3DEAD|nr:MULTISPECIES: S26 family signal peptidase [unclassified Sphingomonas]MCA1197908.1 S26 family signal peptidase [Sphingomonas sp. R647]UUY00404.1 S26 family signal peptidase [Sphingomonas sp. J315]